MSENTNARHVGLWSVAYSSLKGSPWESEDVENAAHASEADIDLSGPAQALKGAYDRMSEDEEAVLAALRATVATSGQRFTPEQLTNIVNGFQVRYDSFEEPLQDFLDEHYGGLRASLLSEDGRKELEGQVCRDSELWVDDDDLPGVYVFTRPGH